MNFMKKCDVNILFCIGFGFASHCDFRLSSHIFLFGFYIISTIYIKISRFIF